MSPYQSGANSNHSPDGRKVVLDASAHRKPSRRREREIFKLKSRS